MRIGQRFNGPPDSAHGGTACGLFAGAVDPRAASVRLLAPPPLDTALGVAVSAEGGSVEGPDGVIATVRRHEASPVEPFPWLVPSDVAAARLHWLATVAPGHVFPTCFGCGHARPLRDGLELFAGETPDRDHCASWLSPDGGFADESGAVPDWVVWAAADCPSGSAVFRHLESTEIVLLGELALRIYEAPVIGTRYQVLARPSGMSGRRLFSEVGIVREDGFNLAIGRATWIRVARAGFLGGAA